MTNKEIAGQLREALKYDGYNRMVADIIEELDPPKPEPGTVVHELTNGTLGIVSPS